MDLTWEEKTGRRLYDESLTIDIPSKTLQDDNIKEDLHGGEYGTSGRYEKLIARQGRLEMSQVQMKKNAEVCPKGIR
jgi:hypothetical protein